MTHCEACYDLGAECECDRHSKTPSTTSKPVDSNIEQLFLDRILFIGNEIPDIDKHRNKFVLLGTPQDLMEDIQSLIDKQVLEGRIEEYQLGLLTGAMPELIGKPMAEEHLAELKALQTNNKEKK